MVSSDNAHKQGSPSALLGRGIRRVREREGKVLADVAAAAQELGIRWDPAAVSRIETGKRALSFDEYLMLPQVLSLTLGRPMLLDELLVRLADVSHAEAAQFVSTSDHRERLFLNLIAPTAHAYLTSVFAETDLAAKIGQRTIAVLEEDMKLTLLARSPADDPPDDRIIERAGDLGVTPSQLLDAATELWGTFVLAHERERRLLASGEDLSNPTRVRTIRGHLTRTLTQELRDHFAANPVKKSRPKRRTRAAEQKER